MRRILSVIAVFAMIAALCLQVSAAGEGSITVNNTELDQSQSVFDLKTGDAQTGEYVYVPNNDRATFSAPEGFDEALTYGDGNETHHDIARTYTWQLGIFSHTAQDKPLAGVTFTVSKSKDGTKPVQFIANGTNDYKLCMKEDETENHVHMTEITTDETGKIKLCGLDADIYYVTEVNAPLGYNFVTAPITVVLNHDEAPQKSLMINYSADGEKFAGELKVMNEVGPQPPEIGSLGTAIFYIVGGFLMTFAAVFVIVRRKMSLF